MEVHLTVRQAQPERAQQAALQLTGNSNQIYADRDIIRTITGRRFDRRLRAWLFPLNQRVVDEITRRLPAVHIGPEVKAAVAQRNKGEAAIERVKEIGWENAQAFAPMPVDLSRLPLKDDGSPATIMQHQVAAFNVACALPATALIMDMGTGKTLTTIAAMGRRYLDSDIDRVLVVAPKSVVPVWPREIDLVADFPVTCCALTGTVARKKKRLNETSGDGLLVMVVNYESLWRMEKETLAWLQAGPAMIVCDESHRIKTVSAAQSKALHRLGRAAHARMALTGTPVTNSPIDYFSQLKFLDPTIFGEAITSFRARYVIYGGYENRQIIGYRNLDEIVERVHSISFRVSKAEALDLPEMTNPIREIELEPAARKVYSQIVKDQIALVAEGEITAENVLTRDLRLSQITGGFVTDDDGVTTQVSSAKLDALRDILESAREADEKVVVFARFKAEMDAIEKLFESMRLGYRVIRGGTTDAQRDEAQTSFQTDDTVRVFLGQSKAACEGITLHAAKIAVFYSLTYSFEQYDQARSRIHRTGLRWPVTNIHLVASKTIDSGVMEALRTKKNVSDIVVDGKWRELIEGEPVVSARDIAQLESSL